MKAVIYSGNNKIQLSDIPEPKIESPTDVVIKVNMSSICASDIHVREDGLQDTGKAIGHEYAGVIEEVGKEVHYLKKGDRVVGKPFSHCGHCFYCRNGQPEICENLSIFGVLGGTGVQAEYAKIPWAENILKIVPADLSFEDVIFVGDILSTGFTGVLRGNLKYGETVAVFGTGPVGLCSVATASLFGPQKVIAVDTLDYRLKLASQFGASITINASKEDPIARIKELTNDRGVDLGVEAAGFEATFSSCLKSVRRGGRISIIGMFTKPTYFNISERFLDLFNLSIGLGDGSHMEKLINLIEVGKIDLKPLITHRLPLSNAMKGYELFEKKLENCVKVLLLS